MPPIWDRVFSQRFYERWGRENAVISAMTRRATYPDYTQLLSIKMMSGAQEEYFIDGRRISVDDDTFLILNAGRRYGSSVDTLLPGRSFSIFFRPGMAQEVRDSLVRSTESLLQDPTTDGRGAVEFGEHLREHEASVTPVLRYIQAVIDRGENSEEWLEEQLQFLLARMLKLEYRHRRKHELLPSSKPATRRELSRRIGLGVNFIHSNFQNSIALADIAAAANLSPFYFLRAFKAMYGMTPSMYLNRKRVSAATRLMRESTWNLTEIAEHVGFGCRTTLFRQLRSGLEPDCNGSGECSARG